MPVITILFSLLFLLPQTAHAYVGPGLGMGAFGVVLGVIFSVLLAIVGIFWYPLKKLLKNTGH